jgi:competence protein ComEC
MQLSRREHSFVPHPLALIFAAFASGISGAHFFTLKPSLWYLPATAAALLSLLFLLKRSNGWATIALLFATLFSGATLAAIEDHSPPSNQIKRLIEEGAIPAGEMVELTGVLDRSVEHTPDSFYLTLRVERLSLKSNECEVSGVVQLLAPVRDDKVNAAYEALQLRYGARLRVATTLQRADNYRNPGVSSLTEFLDRKGYDATGKVKSPAFIERLGDERVLLPLQWLYQWRHTLEREIRAHFSAETAGVLAAALLGNRYYLSRSISERFREGGTFHVLVISGLHISFIGGFVLLIARRFTKRRWLQFVSSAVILWGYTLAVGAESSVVRSALMFSLVALAPVLARSANSLNALGGAGLFLLVWNPRDLFDPSFQLTFLSVLAIVVIAVPLLRKLTMIGAWKPSMQTPYPPNCSGWLRRACEAFYWSEKQWRSEMANANFSYRLFKTPLGERLERYHLQKALRYAAAALIVSTSVQLTLLPLLILYFHRLSLSSLLLNIFVSGLMAALGVVALMALALAQISTLMAVPLIELANLLNWMMVHSVDVFDALGVHSLRLPEYAGWAGAIYAAYYVPLLWLVWRLARWHPLGPPIVRGRRSGGVTKAAAVLQVLFVGLLVSHPLSARQSDGRLRIDFLDVGQGDAALVTMPDGTTLLIDAGGRPSFGTVNAKTTFVAGELFERDARSIGEAVVSEYLWRRGLDKVDYILATHADADHIDGLNDVARNFRVRAALVARRPSSDREYLRFADSLRRWNIPLSVIGAGDVLQFGAATATIIWPRLTDSSVPPSRNNDSIVLRLQFGERTILMTGDIEREAESAIVGAVHDLRTDVIKVPHHGSKTSSTQELVNATQPRFAVISVGQMSMFGHPRPEVVERWNAAGAQVMTTGKKGTITISTDGKDLRVETFIQ